MRFTVAAAALGLVAAASAVPQDYQWKNRDREPFEHDCARREGESGEHLKERLDSCGYYDLNREDQEEIQLQIATKGPIDSYIIPYQFDPPEFPVYAYKPEKLLDVYRKGLREGFCGPRPTPQTLPDGLPYCKPLKEKERDKDAKNNGGDASDKKSPCDGRHPEREGSIEWFSKLRHSIFDEPEDKYEKQGPCRLLGQTTQDVLDDLDKEEARKEKTLWNNIKNFFKGNDDKSKSKSKSKSKPKPEPKPEPKAKPKQKKRPVLKDKDKPKPETPLKSDDFEPTFSTPGVKKPKFGRNKPVRKLAPADFGVGQVTREEDEAAFDTSERDVEDEVAFDAAENQEDQVDFDVSERDVEDEVALDAAENQEDQVAWGPFVEDDQDQIGFDVSEREDEDQVALDASEQDNQDQLSFDAAEQDTEDEVAFDASARDDEEASSSPDITKRSSPWYGDSTSYPKYETPQDTEYLARRPPQQEAPRFEQVLRPWTPEPEQKSSGRPEFIEKFQPSPNGPFNPVVEYEEVPDQPPRGPRTPFQFVDQPEEPRRIPTQPARPIEDFRPSPARPETPFQFLEEAEEQPPRRKPVVRFEDYQPQPQPQPQREEPLPWAIHPTIYPQKPSQPEIIETPYQRRPEPAPQPEVIEIPHQRRPEPERRPVEISPPRRPRVPDDESRFDTLPESFPRKPQLGHNREESERPETPFQDYPIVISSDDFDPREPKPAPRPYNYEDVSQNKAGPLPPLDLIHGSPKKPKKPFPKEEEEQDPEVPLGCKLICGKPKCRVFCATPEYAEYEEPRPTRPEVHHWLPDLEPEDKPEAPRVPRLGGCQRPDCRRPPPPPRDCVTKCEESGFPRRVCQYRCGKGCKPQCKVPGFENDPDCQRPHCNMAGLQHRPNDESVGREPVDEDVKIIAAVNPKDSVEVKTEEQPEKAKALTEPGDKTAKQKKKVEKAKKKEEETEREKKKKKKEKKTEEKKKPVKKIKEKKQPKRRKQRKQPKPKKPDPPPHHFVTKIENHPIHHSQEHRDALHEARLEGFGMPVPGPHASWREKQYYNKVMKDIREGNWKKIQPKADAKPRSIYEENLARNDEYGEEPLAVDADLNDEVLASVEDTEESFLTSDDDTEESFVRDDIEARDDDDDDDDDEAPDSLITASQTAFLPAWNITTPTILPGFRIPNITEAVTSRNLTRRDSPPNWSALREAAWNWRLKGVGDIEEIEKGFKAYQDYAWNRTGIREAKAARKKAETEDAAAAAAAANATAPTNITTPATNITTRGDCNCSGGGSKPPTGDVDPRSECGCSKDKDTGDKKSQDDA